MWRSSSRSKFMVFSSRGHPPSVISHRQCSRGPPLLSRGGPAGPGCTQSPRSGRRRYCFVIVSSRLRMTLATVVQAACSTGRAVRSRGDSPTSRSFDAAARFFWNDAKRPSRAAQDVDLFARRRARGRQTEREDETTFVSVLLRALRAAQAPARLRRRSDRSSSASAWSGVLVCPRRAVHFSRSGASNVASEAGGTVRFHSV